MPRKTWAVASAVILHKTIPLRMARFILSAIINKFNGGPVGVETLAAAVGEEADTIGDVSLRH
jgi:Holliday junction resolvasome RuvABC ATP-dependent DNA helicase subunit